MNEKDVRIIFFSRLKPQLVVQLYVKNKPVLVLGTAASSFHADILRKFLKMSSLEYLTEKANIDSEINKE